MRAMRAPGVTELFDPAEPEPRDGYRGDGCVYCVKAVRYEAGLTLEAYDRGYQFLGTLDASGLDRLVERGVVRQIWPDWTGGLQQVPGVTFWFTAKEVA